MRRGGKEGETGTVAKEEAAEKVTVCVQGGSCEQKKRLRLMADAEEKGWRVMGEGSYERVHRKSDICIIFISPLLSSYLGFPGGASGTEPTCQCRRLRCRFIPWVRKIPGRRKWQSTLVLFPGESHGQRSLVGYSP